jgi:predicted anti-sigma-YlaC factor YlaD
MAELEEELYVATPSEAETDDEEVVATTRATKAKPKGCRRFLTRMNCMYAIVVVWILTGMCILHWVRGFQFVTTLYILVQIITTIGYGDLDMVGEQSDTCSFMPGSADPCYADRMKVFMSFYVLVCIFVIATVITNLAEAAVKRSEDAFRARMRQVQAHASGLSSESMISEKTRARNKLLAAAFFFFAMILIGTIVFGYLSSCTCSYGRTAIDGCKEDDCADTGGATRTVLDAFYMSCITLTTVGFGDQSPKSFGGRIFGCIWMLVGVVATANFVGAFTDFFMEEEKEERKKYNRIDEQIFREIDVNHDGTLSKYEFASFVLRQYGLVQKEDLDIIMQQYEQLDATGDGLVTFEDVEAYFSHNDDAME